MDTKKWALLAAAMFTAQAGAQDQTNITGSEDQINFAYAGDDSRLGIGVDNEGEIVADFLKSFHTDWNRNWMGEFWYSDGAGGLKLDFHRLSGANQKGDLITNEDNLRIWKYFAAVDQNTFDDRKFTLGFGSEAKDFFWNVNGSKAITGERLANTSVTVANNTLFGSDTIGDFSQAQDIETIIRTFEHPYDWGLGGRLGKYFEQSMFRLTGGLDYEEGDFGSDQFTGSVNLEKYFKDSPHSLALNVEQISKSGQFETDKSDTRANVMYRYDFGKNHQPTTVAEEVQVIDEERLAQLKLENRKVVQHEISLASTAFFDLDSDVIRNDAESELMKLIDALKETDLASSISIVGHTCDIASKSYNQDLSERRAESAKNFLARNGVAEAAILASGKGETAPKFDNNDPVEKVKNRRVEISFLTIEEEFKEVDIADEDLPMKWVTKEVEAPAAWINRALNTPAKHKRTVDVYKYQETETNTSLGEKVYLNQAPSANDDSFSVPRTTVIMMLDVLANDSDPDAGDTLTIIDNTQPSNGTVSNNGGSLSYALDPGFIGTETFTYTVEDNDGLTSTATVTVTVDNMLPVATADSANIQTGVASIVDYRTNDYDPDGEVSDLTLTSIDNSNPDLEIADNGNGTLTITALNGYTGTTEFTYTITDADGGTATATIVVTVTSGPPVGNNQPPVAQADSYFTIVNQSKVINPLENDTDPDGDNITLVSVDSSNALGTVTDIQADGSMTYTPPANWCGTDTFTYTITDGEFEVTTTVQISIID
ncbi:Ig-like domain-containing protein [Marinicella rhabdoformis]|uniref:Ig-like domain-containing protein n=1 Tax=Marinicella rhabdoformis TaxID=2580566 RepID=UPI0012AEBE72|nr:Ig-like domain-containing protein [Marinicella rhabdoformis]